MIDFYISLIVALLMALSPLIFAVIIIYFGITSDNIVANVIVPLLGIIILIGSGSLIAYGAKKSNERIERCKAIVSQFDERLEEVDGTIVCYYDGLYCPVFRTILSLKIYNTVNQITNHPKRCILGHLEPFLRYAGRTVFTPKKPLTPHVPKKSRTFAPCLWRRNRTSPAVQQSA